MSEENSSFDRKSLRLFIGTKVDWDELAKDCVAFANGVGGRILVGLEDQADEPPSDQVVPETLGETIQKRMAERTVNVQVIVRPQVASNGGQLLEVAIARSTSVASTTSGRFYLRLGDTCVPITGDDVLRLAGERSGRPWEAMDSGVPGNEASTLEISRLGALLIGGPAGRRAIGTAPIVQAISYDEEGRKINKWSWD